MNAGILLVLLSYNFLTYTGGQESPTKSQPINIVRKPQSSMVPIKINPSESFSVGQIKYDNVENNNIIAEQLLLLKLIESKSPRRSRGDSSSTSSLRSSLGDSQKTSPETTQSSDASPGAQQKISTQNIGSPACNELEMILQSNANIIFSKRLINTTGQKK